MNDTRKAKIKPIAESLRKLQEELETLRDAEQKYVDAVPLDWQDSAKYEEAEEALDYLNEAVDGVENAAWTLEMILI